MISVLFGLVVPVICSVYLFEVKLLIPLVPNSSLQKNPNMSRLQSLLLLFIILLPLASSSEMEAIETLQRRLDSKRAPASVQEVAAKALLGRLLPTHLSSFEFEIVSKDACGGYSCFWINNFNISSRKGAEIMIKGTTAVEIVSGLHWYLKYWCGAHISWDKTGGTQMISIPIPGSLPSVNDEGVMIQRPVPWNYYQNAVTSSYSFVWWDWKRWEKEIDWMALQGVNLPLAFTGQEAIWQKVFKTFNISEEDLNDFFGGPAFLAWSRMGNLHGWGGPLPQTWLDQQLALQKQILSRMIEFGMTPASYLNPTLQYQDARLGYDVEMLDALRRVINRMEPDTIRAAAAVDEIKIFREGSQGFADRLAIHSRDKTKPVLPSFSGNVPAALKRIFPAANITRLGNWNTISGDPRWCCTFLLDPSDPLFVELGEAFIREQIKEYGDVTDIYNCDTFDENSPPTDNPTYISLLGAAVYKAMFKGDKDAVWLMQGWLFSDDSAFWRPPQMRALLQSVPFGKMIVLDLFADVKPVWKDSSQFYGTPYVWCLLHNFAGNSEMYGILDAISSGPVDARLSQNSTMVGVGMCMEGIEQNPVVYELMSEMAFRSEKVELEGWLRSYSRRRYGKPVYQIEEAWRILYQTIYNCTDGISNHNKDYIVEFPDWDPSAIPELSTSKKGKVHLALDRTRIFSFAEMISSLPQPHLWYSTKEVIHALHLFLKAGNDLAGSLTYRYDLVDLTRQVLSKVANQVYLDAVIAFQHKDAKALSVLGERFIQLIKDIDTLLASDDNFLLGNWLESAKSLAVTPNELRQYEWNARTQITMWFDNTETNQSILHDYGNKFWSGLLEDYYLPRASIYFSHLLTSLRENGAFQLEEWRREWISFSNKWQAGTELYPVKAQGDALAIAEALFNKYLSSDLDCFVMNQ